MSGIIVGVRSATSSRDMEGHRTYTTDFTVETEDYDGPGVAMFAAGLPSPGDPYGGYGCNDYDPWAFCTPELQCKVHPDYKDGDFANHWIVTTTHTTKPMKRCNSTNIEDPLMEPPKLSGGFNKVTRERLVDRFGQPLLYTTFERIKGPTVERRDGLPTLTVSVNVLTLPLAGYLAAVECVNDAPFWGFAKRWVRLTDITWTRALYGTCFFYFTVNYTFEFKPGGYDPPILNMSNWVLKLDGDKDKPEDYVQIEDEKDAPAGPKPIKEDGTLAVTIPDDLYYLDKEIDSEFNFALLPGVPMSL